jgi:hypothetical protein
MSADHDTLDALRRLARDRAATPAEKATARRLAKALAAKIGKSPRRSRRKTQSAALPEPSAARWRRLWIVWLEGALHKLAVAGDWVHWFWIASLIVIGPAVIIGFGTDLMRQQAGDIYLVRSLGLVAVASIMMAMGGVFTFAVWWLKTWRGDRLRPALMSLTKGLPWFATLCLVAYLDHSFFKPNLASLSVTQTMMAFLALLAVTSAVMVTICIPWWRWVQPAVERAVVRANIGALRAGVAVAIAVIILAGGGVWGLWAYAHHAHARDVTAPPEFEVPAPSPIAP